MQPIYGVGIGVLKQRGRQLQGAEGRHGAHESNSTNGSDDSAGP